MDSFDPVERAHEARRALEQKHAYESAILDRDLALAESQRLRKIESNHSRPGVPRDWLVIGDAHAKPHQSLDRFEWAGNLAVERRPSIIVAMGDWWDMGSLWGPLHGYEGSHGKPERYAEDISAGLTARARFWAPIAKYNKSRKNKYDPQLLFLEGNHEYRIQKWLMKEPALDGKVSMDDLLTDNEQYGGWTHVPYLRRVVIDGTALQHYFVPPGGRMAIAGVNPARSHLIKGFMSCIAGHSHRKDEHTVSAWDGRRLQAIIAGCFFLEDQGYESEASRDGQWWRGLLYRHGVENGYGESEWIGMDRIRREWG